MSHGFFGAPAPVRAVTSLRTGTAALAVLGLTHASAEWRPRLALYRVGRGPWEGAAPYALWALALGCAVLLLFNRAPRASALGCCAALAALHALAPQLYHNNYYVLWLYLAALALEAPRGAAVSSLVPRIVQVQVALVYALSVVAKLAHPWWREGGAVVRWIVTERVPNSGVVGVINPALGPALRVPALAAATQAGMMALELLLPVMLFRTRWRRAAFVIGAVMHALMQEWLFPQLFTFLMLLGYYAFAPAEDRGWTLTLDPSRAAHGALARALPSLDWRARVRLVEDHTAETLTLTDPAGITRAGVGALWMLAVLCPATVVGYAALALLAPGVTSVAGVPRTLVENLVVIAVGVTGLLPGKAPSHRRGAP